MMEESFFQTLQKTVEKAEKYGFNPSEPKCMIILHDERWHHIVCTDVLSERQNAKTAHISLKKLLENPQKTCEKCLASVRCEMTLGELNRRFQEALLIAEQVPSDEQPWKALLETLENIKKAQDVILNAAGRRAAPMYTRAFVEGIKEEIQKIAEKHFKKHEEEIERTFIRVYGDAEMLHVAPMIKDLPDIDEKYRDAIEQLGNAMRATIAADKRKVIAHISESEMMRFDRTVRWMLKRAYKISEGLYLLPLQLMSITQAKTRAIAENPSKEMLETVAALWKDGGSTLEEICITAELLENAR